VIDLFQQIEGRRLEVALNLLGELLGGVRAHLAEDFHGGQLEIRHRPPLQHQQDGNRDPEQSDRETHRTTGLGPKE
jgi:hypothetical protein